MKPGHRILLGTTAIVITGLAIIAVRVRDVPRITTGFVSHLLCSATFVSGSNSDTVYADTIDAMPGARLIGWALTYQVDRTRKQVTTTLIGSSESRAVYRDGLGCRIETDRASADAAPSTASPALLKPIELHPVLTADPALSRAFDRAFAETAGGPRRHTKAVVIMKDGRIIAERYARGYDATTPLLGWSATKSAVNALIGILVRQSRIAVEQPVLMADWQNPDDPRHGITIDHLLRHTSGLAMGDSLNASLASALAPVNRMKFMERDMAGYAMRASVETPPGKAWSYHDGNFAILSRIIRDAAGGHADDVLRFARQELFDPLGMDGVTLEFDATGTPEGATQMLAPARAWARLGQLYLDDGVVGGRRILPNGWVDYSKRPTAGAWVGYGAGFWTNQGDSFGASYRTAHGWPRDSFYASGTFGQYVIVLPSQRLVIARFGVAGDRGDINGTSRLVADVIAATGEAH